LLASWRRWGESADVFSLEGCDLGRKRFELATKRDQDRIWIAFGYTLIPD
jgi:hypothetical protein